MAQPRGWNPFQRGNIPVGYRRSHEHRNLQSAGSGPGYCDNLDRSRYFYGYPVAEAPASKFLSPHLSSRLPHINRAGWPQGFVFQDNRSSWQVPRRSNPPQPRPQDKQQSGWYFFGGGARATKSATKTS